MDPIIHNLVELVRLLQSKLTGAQRIEAWKQMQQGYCKCCGQNKDGAKCYNNCDEN